MHLTSAKRFTKTHSDEMGTYGFYTPDVRITNEAGAFVCWLSQLNNYLKAPKCKQAV